MYSLALHIFRRDLRLHDNNALLHALQNARQVIPCFIFDPRQVGDNPYKSHPAITFMIESLQDLSQQLERQNGKLYIFYGKAEEVVAQLSSQIPIDLVTFHRDYTPFAKKRDQAIQQILYRSRIHYQVMPDVLLHEPESIRKKDDKPYSVFTHFFRQAILRFVPTPSPNPATHYWTEPIPDDQGIAFLQKMRPPPQPHLLLRGGSKEGQKLLKKAQSLHDYQQKRDYPAARYVSYLSPHHKFGTISIRATYHALKKSRHTDDSPLLRQIYWRDFFTHVAHHFPHIWDQPFHRHFANIPWVNKLAHFKKWAAGTTGFPIVDAGMRQLNTTGYMHNRLRMITASFLIKDLHIDWRWGERYFAKKLIDYDPAVNNGNWQWVASTGCDAQPYFRIFNPWRQQKRFDPQTLYIKEWIPELRPFTPRQIHDIPTNNLSNTHYPPPMVDHDTATAHTKNLYKIDQTQFGYLP